MSDRRVDKPEPKPRLYGWQPWSQSLQTNFGGVASHSDIVANAGVSEVSPLVCRCFNQKARQCLTNFGVLLFGHPPPPQEPQRDPRVPGMLWATGGKTISPVAPGASKRTTDTHQSGSKTCSRSVGRGGGVKNANSYILRHRSAPNEPWCEPQGACKPAAVRKLRSKECWSTSQGRLLPTEPNGRRQPAWADAVAAAPFLVRAASRSPPILRTSAYSA